MGTDIDAVSDIIEHMDRQLRSLYLKREDGFREKRSVKIKNMYHNEREQLYKSCSRYYFQKLSCG